MGNRILITLTALLLCVVASLGADRRFTLVVDAGHGGHDDGAMGAISLEKNLTLKYALAFGQMVRQRCPDVKVIFTRTTDVFLPLHGRADIANNNKADLFISFHINAVAGSHSVHGFQSYTLGRGERTGDKGLKENLDVAKRENSVIYMEKDYQKVYSFDSRSAESNIMYEFMADKNREMSVDLSRMMQQEVCRATGRVDGGGHQNNLAVLRLTSMPAILLELGFISTPDEETFLNSDEALTEYTQGIFQAFLRYKAKYDDNIDVPYRDATADDQLVMVPTKQTQPAKKTTPAKNSTPAKNTTPAKKATPAKKTVAEKKTTPEKKTSGKKGATVKQAADQPVFKIQIAAGKYKLKPTDSQFKGLEGIECFQDGANYKYMYGANTNYNVVNRLRKQILDKFPSCYIVAFKQGKLMDVNEAIRVFKANR